MAKVDLNTLLQNMSGTLGKTLVFRQMRDGSIIVSGKPDFSHRKFSKGQLTHQSRFQEAVRYARGAAKSNPIYAELAQSTTKTAYNIALSDWFNPPVIHNVHQQNGIIRVEAADNVMVARVHVTILDEAGKVLEQGEAVLIKDKLWEYLTVTTGKVIVEAWDLAGHTARKEL